LSLERLVQEVGKLGREASVLPPSQIVAGIDSNLSDDLRIFADGRESLTAEFGLTVFADVMSSFASGERAVNRAWCAAADGYVNEAEACLQRGETMFQVAMEQFQAAEQVDRSSDV
ncbi:MAG: hypothetical protein VX438_13525, partial [Planctomycetota bacterium]|nr:hypothetical protein [Planctomycetota bacterium]